MDDFIAKEFKQLLTQLARKRFPKETPRQGLANEVKCSDTMVQRYFRGDALGAPSDGFQKILRSLVKDETPSQAAFVLASYLEFILKKTGGNKFPELQTAATYLKELVLRDNSSQLSSLLGANAPNLANFPGDFYPLIIVCGDRRERPQKDWSDLFASSMSPLDLTFLLRLGLRPETVMANGSAETTLIFSDRSFACTDESLLRRSFSNATLLVVGSPKVNLLARDANFSSLFRFTLKRTHEARILHQRLRNQELLCQSNLVQAFGIMCRSSPHAPLTETQRQELGLSRKQVEKLLELGYDLLGQAAIGEAAEMFYPTGISDLASRYHRTRTSDSRRVGLVSLASHPFNPQRLCIMVAGIDGVGTAHCLKSLAHAKKAYAEHPFGGVLTVAYNDPRHEPQKATYQVERPTYKPADILESLDEIIRAKQESETSATRETSGLYEPWSLQDALDATKLVQRLSPGQF